MAYITTQHWKNMANIARNILKFKSVIKKSVGKNHTFFTIAIL